jgi:hypothetical protein
MAVTLFSRMFTGGGGIGYMGVVQNTEVKGIFPSLGEGDRREFMFSTLMVAKYCLLYVLFQQRCLTASHHKLLAYSMM